MDVRMKPTPSFEDRPRSLSLTVAACMFVILFAYLFSCVPRLEGANPRRPAARTAPSRLPASTPEEQGMDADNFLGDFSDTSWYTEGAIFRMIAMDVLPAAY
ncbi:hypothetical protein ACFLQM_00085 [Acidobacteriota bacterium]